LVRYFKNSRFDPEGPIETYNFEDANKNYVIHFKCKIPTENLEGKLSISPISSDFLPGNLFPESVRKLPVNLSYTPLHTLTCSILIPPGYKVPKLPDDYYSDDDYMKIAYSSKQDGDIIKISAMYTFKKITYQPEEYINLRLHFIDINSKFNQKIIMLNN